MDIVTRLIEAAVGIACGGVAAVIGRGDGPRWLAAVFGVAAIAAIVHAALG